MSLGAEWMKPLKVRQNVDYSKTLGFAAQASSGNTASATAVAFGGMTAKMQIRMGQLSTSTLLQTLTTGGGGLTLGSATTSSGIPVGTIQIVLTHLQTLALPAGEWWYDVIVYNGSDQSEWLHGPFAVAPVRTT